MATIQLIGTAFGAVAACVGLGPAGVEAVTAAVEKHAVVGDVDHLGDALVHAAIMRSDSPFEALDSVTCADNPCTHFVETELGGLTVSGRTDVWTYQKAGSTTFVLVGRSGDVTVTYDSARGGITSIEDAAAPVDPGQGGQPADDPADDQADDLAESTVPETPDEFGHCPWPSACEGVAVATEWLADLAN